MKSMLFLTLLIVATTAFAQDTVRVTVNRKNCITYMPSRYWIVSASPKVPSPSDSSYKYLDSIRVCGQIIYKSNQRYYLIVIDSTGKKCLEGNFFDSYADGHVVTYDDRGRKFSEGDYIIKGKSRKRRSIQSGTWKYYNSKGELIREEKH